MDDLEMLDEYVLDRILLTGDHNIYDLYYDFSYWQKCNYDKVQVKKIVFMKYIRFRYYNEGCTLIGVKLMKDEYDD